MACMDAIYVLLLLGAVYRTRFNVNYVKRKYVLECGVLSTGGKPMNSKKIGYEITRLRLEAGYSTIDALADAAGIAPTTLARIEHGDTKNPSPETLKKLAPHLKIAPDILLNAAGITEKKVPPEFLNLMDMVEILDDQDRQSFNQDLLKYGLFLYEQYSKKPRN